jgi:hypothetical protein
MCMDVLNYLSDCQLLKDGSTRSHLAKLFKIKNLNNLIRSSRNSVHKYFYALYSRIKIIVFTVRRISTCVYNFKTN